MCFTSFQFAWRFVANSFLRKEQSLWCVLLVVLCQLSLQDSLGTLEDLEIALQSVLRAVCVHRECVLHPFSSLGDL